MERTRIRKKSIGLTHGICIFQSVQPMHIDIVSNGLRLQFIMFIYIHYHTIDRDYKLFLIGKCSFEIKFAKK